jgi:hypothetical protein
MKNVVRAWAVSLDGKIAHNPYGDYFVSKVRNNLLHAYGEGDLKIIRVEIRELSKKKRKGRK